MPSIKPQNQVLPNSDQITDKTISLNSHQNKESNSTERDPKLKSEDFQTSQGAGLQTASQVMETNEA